jgi:hypothetical protein
MLQREHILLRICQALIVVIILQSIKLVNFSQFYTSHMLTNSLLHIVNMSVHILLFLLVLIFLKRKAIYTAKMLLIFSFSSYIVIACYLWQYDVNLQYYFLLTMFITCYVFDRYETSALSLIIVFQLCAFTLMQQLPAIDRTQHLETNQANIGAYLHNIAYVNALVFALSCLICALFIRSILATNWQQLSDYEERQSHLLSKLFPAELVPSLLSTCEQSPHVKTTINSPQTDFNLGPSKMQSCFVMGVIFLDLVDFTQANTKQQNTHLHWQHTYRLFAKFDEAINAFDVKRIKTNGDQYILLLGLQSRDSCNKHKALQLVDVCKALLKTSERKVRIGAAFGHVTCGIFDHNNPNFDIWGETVIRAARLEKIAKPDQILVDESTFHLSSDVVVYASPLKYELKGLGEHLVYALGNDKTLA